MVWMFPLLTAWIGYTMIAALPLYWAVSNSVSILQQTIIMREEVDKMEEATVVTKVRTADSGTKKLTSGSDKKKKKRG
jgi:YidC/Oxa1 family membrane protein insertase